MARLAEKVAVITGGSGGIGMATAERFVQEGAKVLLVDVQEAALQKAVVALGEDVASYVVADVTQPEQVKGYVQAAVEQYGGIDIFINNAGIEGERNLITEYSIEMFDYVMAVNVRGVWLGMKYVIPEMEKRGGGSIVITSSVAGLGGFSNFAPYAASKHAVIGIMRSAAAECAAQGIRVNTVNPGFTDTRMIRSLEEMVMPGAEEEVRQQLVQSVGLQRYAQPQEIAQMMLFLASDESSYCTGGVYVVDGGLAKRN